MKKTTTINDDTQLVLDYLEAGGSDEKCFWDAMESVDTNLEKAKSMFVCCLIPDIYKYCTAYEDDGVATYVHFDYEKVNWQTIIDRYNITEDDL